MKNIILIIFTLILFLTGCQKINNNTALDSNNMQSIENNIKSSSYIKLSSDENCVGNFDASSSINAYPIVSDKKLYSIKEIKKTDIDSNLLKIIYDLRDKIYQMENWFIESPGNIGTGSKYIDDGRINTSLLLILYFIISMI